ncbi:MAG: prepilin peptidase [Candidatus Berkelbacteria bacterium]|nr:prepilin peptidase [Candidatus Berkelbacteria bacterium]
MTLAIGIIVFLTGLSIGSFLNVVILRIDNLQSILTERSQCPKCKKIINWYDLIPFLSFMLLKAKCRFCNEKISWQYPIVEVGTAFLFLFLFLTLGLSWGLVFYVIVFSLLTVLFVYDLKTETVPEVLVWIALGLAVLGGWYYGHFGLSSMLLGALIGGGPLALLVYVSKERWMGVGDIKIGLILGVLCGYPRSVVAMFSAFVIGSVVGIIYLLLTDKKVSQKGLKKSLPFAPFIILATLIGITYGDRILHWYLGFLS